MRKTGTEWLSCIKISMYLSKTDYMHILESFYNECQCNKIYFQKKFKLVGR